MAGRRQGAAEKDRSLAARAAWLSYIGGHTQGEIAARLSVSPAKAHRLIALAHEQGLVKVFIEGAPEECLALEGRLADAFALESCVVAPALGNADEDDRTDGPEAFAAVGAAAARLLHGLLGATGAMLVGVGKGRSLAAMVDNLPAMRRADLKFVSVSGSLTRNLAANPFDVVHKLVERTGGEGYFLPVPYIAASVEEKRLLLMQKSVQDLLRLARQAELYVIGIGSIADDAHVRQVGMVTEAEWTELRARGAVGDVMGSFVDADGRPVDAGVNRHSLGLGIDDLRERRVIAVAGGGHKGEAILAALRTGVISDLVLGEQAARNIADRLDAGEAADKPRRQAG